MTSNRTNAAAKTAVEQDTNLDDRAIVLPPGLEESLRAVIDHHWHAAWESFDSCPEKIRKHHIFPHLLCVRNWLTCPVARLRFPRG
jgi:hypothetical protein